MQAKHLIAGSIAGTLTGAGTIGISLIGGLSIPQALYFAAFLGLVAALVGGATIPKN